MSEYLSVQEACEIAGVSDDTIRRAIKSGLLPSNRPGNGKLIRIHKDHLAVWMEFPDEPVIEGFRELPTRYLAPSDREQIASLHVSRQLPWELRVVYKGKPERIPPNTKVRFQWGAGSFSATVRRFDIEPDQASFSIQPITALSLWDAASPRTWAKRIPQIHTFRVCPFDADWITGPIHTDKGPWVTDPHQIQNASVCRLLRCLTLHVGNDVPLLETNTNVEIPLGEHVRGIAASDKESGPLSRIVRIALPQRELNSLWKRARALRPDFPEQFRNEQDLMVLNLGGAQPDWYGDLDPNKGDQLVELMAPPGIPTGASPCEIRIGDKVARGSQGQPISTSGSTPVWVFEARDLLNFVG